MATLHLEGAVEIDPSLARAESIDLAAIPAPPCKGPSQQTTDSPGRFPGHSPSLISDASITTPSEAFPCGDEAELRALASVLGIQVRGCCCDVCWRTSTLCPAVLTDLRDDVCAAMADKLAVLSPARLAPKPLRIIALIDGIEPCSRCHCRSCAGGSVSPCPTCSGLGAPIAHYLAYRGDEAGDYLCEDCAEVVRESDPILGDADCIAVLRPGLCRTVRDAVVRAGRAAS